MRSISIVSLVGAFAVGISSAAYADEAHQGMSPFSAVDAFVTHSSLEGSGGTDIDDSDIGGGLRLRMGFGDLFFVEGGFQSVSINNPELSDGSSVQGGTLRFRDQYFSGGLRYALLDDRLIPYLSVGEYRTRTRFNDGDGNSVRVADSSLIAAVGLHYKIVPGLHLMGQYRRADDLNNGDFDELSAGVAYQFARSLGVFAEYRRPDFDFDDAGEFKVDEFRLGLRFSFAADPSDDFF